MTLDLNNKDPAYLCGRLFAELAQAQRSAVGDTGATIVDRYFGTASTAPAAVFGLLLRLNRHHLSKLHRDKRGAYVNIERRIGEITAGLPKFPSTLDLREQALFSLGFYHQKASHFAQPTSNSRTATDDLSGADSDD